MFFPDWPMQDLHHAAWVQLIEHIETKIVIYGYSLPCRAAPPRATLPAILSTATVSAPYYSYKSIIAPFMV
jgi:desulfoferrodoxin (superoxide reductase-like protein)